MSDSKNRNFEKGKLLFYIGIPVVLLFVILRFGLYYLKSDGFNGISMLLPIFLIGFIFFALGTSTFFATWVYQDCKRRGDDPVLWAIIVFIATPFIGLLIYFLRRLEIKQSCPSCRHQISLKAKYCEECGMQIKNKEDFIMEKQRTHHLKYIVAGVVSLTIMLVCLTGFIVSATTSGNINTDITSNEKVWNLGTISMNYNTYLNGTWKLDFKSASDGFVAQEKMNIENSQTEKLYADISCKSVPDDSSLILYLVQGDTFKSVDVTNLSEPIEYSLNEFKAGAIYVRLKINGVENTTSKIYIK